MTGTRTFTPWEARSSATKPMRCTLVCRSSRLKPRPAERTRGSRRRRGPPRGGPRRAAARPARTRWWSCRRSGRPVSQMVAPVVPAAVTCFSCPSCEICPYVIRAARIPSWRGPPSGRRGRPRPPPSGGCTGRSRRRRSRSVSSGLVRTPCSATYASTSSCVQRAIGDTLTLRRLASQPTTGVPARVGDSSRRSPRPRRRRRRGPPPAASPCAARSYRSGSRSCSAGPYCASCSATVWRGVSVMTLTSITAATASRVPMVSSKW